MSIEPETDNFEFLCKITKQSQRLKENNKAGFATLLLIQLFFSFLLNLVTIFLEE